MTIFLLVGSISIGKLPTGLGEAVFLIGAETSFGAFQVLQTSLSLIFSQVMPPEYLVSYIYFIHIHQSNYQ